MTDTTAAPCADLEPLLICRDRKTGEPDADDHVVATDRRAIITAHAQKVAKPTRTLLRGGPPTGAATQCNQRSCIVGTLYGIKLANPTCEESGSVENELLI